MTPALLSSGRFFARAPPRGAGRRLLREPAGAEARLDPRPQQDDVHGGRPRQPAARRPDRRRLRPAQAATEPRHREGAHQRRSSSAPRAATSVGSVQSEIQTLYPNAQVASAKDVADQISGSLVNASNLSHRLGIALEILAAVAAFLLAVLLTLASVGKRVRELGTLKALGWTQRLVVRQVVGESLAAGRARRAPRGRARGPGRARGRRLRRHADGAHVGRRRVRLRRARPHGERHGEARRADVGRRSSRSASCSPSSAACSPAPPAPSGPPVCAPPTR